MHALRRAILGNITAAFNGNITAAFNGSITAAFNGNITAAANGPTAGNLHSGYVSLLAWFVCAHRPLSPHLLLAHHRPLLVVSRLPGPA
jgi:hypothetical protein